VTFWELASVAEYCGSGTNFPRNRHRLSSQKKTVKARQRNEAYNEYIQNKY